MKIFGIQIGNVIQESTEVNIKEPQIKIADQILHLISNIPDGHRHQNKELKNLCLANPQIIAEMIFSDNTDEQIKSDLLFSYSKDHGGGVPLKTLPMWVDMMEMFILPRFDELSYSMAVHTKWYFEDKYNLPSPVFLRSESIKGDTDD